MAYWSRKALALAVASLLLAATALGALALQYARALAALGQPVPVVVAARPLAAGQVLAAQDMAVRWVPGSFAGPGQAAGPEALVGHVLAIDVPAGAAIPSYAVRPPPRVAAGQRAWELRASDRVVIDGLLQPGDLADILAAVGQGGQGTVREVAAAVPVVAVERGQGGVAVTLAVTLHQAREMMEAENFARQVRVLRAATPAAAPGAP